MTDFTREWIAKREQLEGAAAPSPWRWEPPSGGDWPVCDESLATEDGEAVLFGWGYDASGIDGAPADREFIADARTALPAAVAALKAVLDEHPATRLGCITHYARSDCECEPRFTCATCAVTHPCPTVAAIHATLRAES